MSQNVKSGETRPRTGSREAPGYGIPDHPDVTVETLQEVITKMIQGMKTKGSLQRIESLVQYLYLKEP